MHSTVTAEGITASNRNAAVRPMGRCPSAEAEAASDMAQEVPTATTRSPKATTVCASPTPDPSVQDDRSPVTKLRPSPMATTPLGTEHIEHTRTGSTDSEKLRSPSRDARTRVPPSASIAKT